jgi:hypothetical protein
MRRLCVINVAGASPRLLAAGGQGWLRSLPAPPRAMGTVFPAVPPAVQASMTTGVTPGVHGVVAGCVFRRQSRHIGRDERSNTLLNKKRFWHGRHLPESPRTAMVFWYHAMAGGADVVVGVTSYGPSCGRVVSQPLGVADELTGQLGPLDPGLLRGPAASWRASEWIASAARKLLRERPVDLAWVHLPGVNFELARHGPEAHQTREALAGVEKLAAGIAEDMSSAGGETVVVSDGGYVSVSQVGRPNARLREAGLLEIAETPDGPAPDLERSRAFALVDHQVAHLYCRDEDIADEAAAVVAEDPAVQWVRPRAALFEPGLGHDRAGERVAAARTDAWLAYHWWGPEDEPPAAARRADFAGRCGHDPCELLAGDEPDTIDPDPTRVRSSRGRADVEPDDACLLAATCELPPQAESPSATDLPAILRRLMFDDGA